MQVASFVSVETATYCQSSDGLTVILLVKWTFSSYLRHSIENQSSSTAQLLPYALYCPVNPSINWWKKWNRTVFSFAETEILQSTRALSTFGLRNWCHKLLLKTINTNIPTLWHTFHGLRIPLKKFGMRSGKTTASRNNLLASVNPAISSLETDKFNFSGGRSWSDWIGTIWR